MALLDTTVFVDLGGRGGKKRKAEAQDVLRQLMLAGESLFTSIVNLAELYMGLELSADPKKEQEAIDDYLAWLGILGLDTGAAREYGRVRAYLQKQGKLVGDMDILIGAIALAGGHAVVTRNAAHFHGMPGLRIIGYGG